MLGELVRKEIFNNLLNMRFTLAYFLCTFLLVGCAAMLLGEYVDTKKTYAINSSIYNDMEQSHDAVTTATTLANRQTTIFRKPQLLRIFAYGSEHAANNRAKLNTQGMPGFSSDFKRNPTGFLFPVTDIMFIIGIIISLLICILTYDSINGEREEGTLKVILACPLPRATLFFAKWLGGFITLAIPIVTAWIIIMLLIAGIPGIMTSTSDWLRIITLLGVALGYIAVIFSLSLMISTLIKESSSAIIALLVVWAIDIIAIPALAPSAGYLIKRVPSINLFLLTATQKITGEFRSEASTDWIKSFVRINELQQEIYNDESIRNNPDHPLKVEVGKLTLKSSAWITGLISREMHVREIQDIQVNSIAEWINRFSPYGCMQNLALNLAGTGWRHENALQKSITTLSQANLTVANAALESGHNVIPREATVPTFKQPIESIVTSLGNSSIDIAVLGIMGVLFFMIGYLAFLRMDII